MMSLLYLVFCVSRRGSGVDDPSTNEFLRRERGVTAGGGMEEVTFSGNLLVHKARRAWTTSSPSKTTPNIIRLNLRCWDTDGHRGCKRPPDLGWGTGRTRTNLLLFLPVVSNSCGMLKTLLSSSGRTAPRDASLYLCRECLLFFSVALSYILKTNKTSFP